MFRGAFPGRRCYNEHIDVQANHDTLVRELGAASAVLLKNEYGAMPLGKRTTKNCSGAGSGMAGPNQFTDHVRFNN